jgi:short-subunit dehydrogenase
MIPRAQKGLFHPLIWLQILYRRLRPAQAQAYSPVILITGAGSGLGLALARLFSKLEGYRLVLTAREKTLNKLKHHFVESESLMIRALDVTSEENRKRLIAAIDERWGGVDILINNAGISYRAVVEHMTDKDELIQLETNYLGPMSLIRLVLPTMRAKGRGKIINVSSVSGMLEMPTMASYSASKYALEGASEALWYEMKPLGINVTLIQPGFIRSNSFQNVYYTEASHPSSDIKGPYRDYYFYMEPFIEKLMSWSPVTPTHIAKKILKIVRTENPPLWVPVTPDAYIFYYIRRLMPRRLLLPFLFYSLPKARLWARDYTQKRHHYEP